MSDTTPPNSSSDTPSIPELENFIFKRDEYRSEIVPRKLVPSEVAKFLLGKIEKDTKLYAALQTVKVVEFYDTHEVVGKFKQFLDKNEANAEDVRRSIAFTKIIARVGTGDDIEFAKQYFVYLVGRADSIQEFEDLVSLYESIGLGGNSTALRQRIETKLKTLEAKKQGDYQASLEYHKLSDISSYKLIRAEQANKQKDKILTIKDRNQRLDEEIKAYLAVQYGYIEFLQIWAAQRLRREAWSAKLDEQTTRPENPPLNEDVAKAFRRLLDQLDKLPNMTPEGKDSLRLRSLRAIRFFGGKVSEQEEEILGMYKNEQLDILANEGFMLDQPN